MKSHVKKLKSDAQYKWRSEGNKIQFNSNTENMEDLTQALWAIDNTKIDYARDLVIACIERLKQRNKLIKIADTSDGGWDTARQYEANPIASDCDDESKIIRAENVLLGRRSSKTKVQGRSLAITPLPYNLQDIIMFHLCHPFEGPSNLGTQVSHSHKVPMLGKVNEDPATLADQSNIGGPTVHLSATSQLSKQRPETEFVKDEYFVYNVENSDNSDHIEKFTHDYFEYEQGHANIIVKGRLKSNMQFWIDKGAYDFIINTIRDGYKIPFYSVPPSVCLSNNLSVMKHTDFVDSAIQDLLDRGLIVTCEVQPTVVNPLTVSIHSNGKKRLILDLRVVTNIYGNNRSSMKT